MIKLLINAFLKTIKEKFMSVHPVGEAIRYAQYGYQENANLVVEKRKASILSQGDIPDSSIITKALCGFERCVRGYSKREGLTGTFSGIIYRIWNAIKAIFGQSDWQIARRALKDLMIELPKTDLGTNFLKCFFVSGNAEAQGHLDISSEGLTKLGFQIDNNDLDTILNHFVAVDGNRSLRKFLTAPVIQRLMSSKTTSRRDYLENCFEIYSIMNAVYDIKNRSSESFYYILRMPIDISRKKGFEYLLEPVARNRDRLDAAFRALSASQKESEEQFEALVKDVPEFAEFLPLFELSRDEFNEFYAVIRRSFDKIDLKKYQL